MGKAANRGTQQAWLEAWVECHAPTDQPNFQQVPFSPVWQPLIYPRTKTRLPASMGRASEAAAATSAGVW